MREAGFYWVRRYYIVEQGTGDPMVGYFDGGGWTFVDNAEEWIDDGRVVVLSERLAPPGTPAPAPPTP